MKKQSVIGVLAFHGDVLEHLEAVARALKNIKKEADVIEVRTKEDVARLDALIVPGGESTTLYKLCEREEIFEALKKVPNIFGTCAGAIMLAKHIRDRIPGQKTLELMDIEVERNAYGRQSESFEADIQTTLGAMHAIFIRAPRITKVSKNVHVLAEREGGVIACEQTSGGKYYLALAFHPELSTTFFHEHFLKKPLSDPTGNRTGINGLKSRRPNH